MGKLIKLIDL